MENDQLYIFRISVDVRNFRALRRLPLPVASIFVKVTFPAEVVQLALESTSKQAGKQLFFNSGQTIFIVPLSHQKAESRQRSEQYQERSGKKVAPPLINFAPSRTTGILPESLCRGIMLHYRDDA